MPSSAERRLARDDLPPRRIRATVPAHSNPECTGVLVFEFDSLINQTPTSETASLTVRRSFHQSVESESARTAGQASPHMAIVTTLVRATVVHAATANPVTHEIKVVSGAKPVVQLLGRVTTSRRRRRPRPGL